MFGAGREPTAFSQLLGYCGAAAAEPTGPGGCRRRGSLAVADDHL